MQLDVYPAPSKFIRDLEPKRYKQVVSKVLSLLNNPKPQDSEELSGFSFLRVDTGEYRIIYSHTDDVVTIIIVGKRNDDEVYRELIRNYRQDKP